METITFHSALFDCNLQPWLSYGEYLYVEPSYNDVVNHCIEAHYDTLASGVKRNMRFVYLPRLMASLGEIVNYNRPGAHVDVPKVDRTFVQGVYDEIFAARKDVKGWRPDKPMLMRCECGNKTEVEVALFTLNYTTDQHLLQWAQRVFDTPPDDTCLRYSTIRETPPYEDPKDRADAEEINVLAQEIRERIARLRLMGVQDSIIRRLVTLPEPKLSTLCITKDYRIILPDYDGMEINMPTLSKVVYFFYLRHPEGVLFKELVDHRAELLMIYYRLSNREDIGKLEHSIDELVDSTRNSINEKCSRIRSAFVSQFTDDLARHYYITQGDYRRKRITLDRSLLIDESGITSKDI